MEAKASLSYALNSIENPTTIIIIDRGTTGAAGAPKLDKTTNTAARRRCRNLFFKIKVRPRSCRSYPIWRPCSGYALNLKPLIKVSKVS